MHETTKVNFVLLHAVTNTEKKDDEEQDEEGEKGSLLTQALHQVAKIPEAITQIFSSREERRRNRGGRKGVLFFNSYLFVFIFCYFR
mgnify:CR=1 FL=1